MIAPRTMLWALALGGSCLLLALSGCQGSPATPHQAPQGGPAGPRSQLSAPGTPLGDGQSVLATFALHIDTNTLAAVAEPLWKRDGSAQGDVVDLDLAPLFDGRLDSIEAGILNELPNMFAVAGLGFDASGNLVVHFTHQHPWTSPNTFLETNTGVAGNPNATPPVPSDRADLGYTGRLVVIADLIGSQLDGSGNPLPRFRYFTASEPDTILNPTALVAPDGFVTAPLLWADGPFGGVGGPPSPMKANTFPYVLLADDGVRNRLGTVTGNRASPSNNGNVLGNYSPTNRTGWQRADAKLTDFESLQTSPVQWTGFDFVHQRQTVENHFTLHRDFVAAQPGGSWTINVALVVKHTNPRVGSGPPFIPLATDTFAQFAYRLPHAALDVSAIRGLPVTRPQVMMPGGSAGSVNIPLNVRDWDVSQGFDPQLSLPVHLSTQELLETVPNGAAARPTGFADVPGVVATPVAVNDLATGNGLPGSELDYDVTISIPAATPGGVYPVVFRMEDPEVAIQDLSSWYSQTGVVPDWATPPDPLTEPQYALRPRTYQATEIAVCPVITGITPQFVSGNGIACGSRWRFVPIPSLDDISALNPTYIWSFGSGAVPSTSTDRDPVVRFTEPGTHQITLHVLTAACSIPMFSTSYNVDDPIARPAFTTPPSGTLATRAAPHSIGRGSAVVVVPGTAIDTSFRNRIMLFCEDYNGTTETPAIRFYKFDPGVVSENVEDMGPLDLPVAADFPANSRIFDIDAMATDEGIVLAVNNYRPGSCETESTCFGTLWAYGGHWPLEPGDPAGPEREDWSRAEVDPLIGGMPLPGVEGVPTEGSDQVDLVLGTDSGATATFAVAYYGLEGVISRNGHLDVLRGTVEWNSTNPPALQGSVTQVDNSGDVGQDPSIVVSSGQFIVAYKDAGVDRVKIAAAPVAGGSWSTPYDLGTSSADCFDISLAVNPTPLSRPAIAYQVHDHRDAELWYRRASVAQPSSAGDWGTAYRLSDGGGALPYGSGAETDLIFWDDRPAVSFLRLHRIGECDTDSDLGLIRSCLANPDMAAKWEPLDSGSNQILVGTGDPGALGLENTLVGYIDPATQQHRLLVAYFQQDTACDTTFTFRRSTAWW